MICEAMGLADDGEVSDERALTTARRRFRAVATDLDAHLDEAELLPSKAKEWTDEDIETARTLIPDLVIVIRTLLFEHRIRASGDCQICASAWPCPVRPRSTPC
ncbi:MAG: hypothetical protein ACRDTC_16350 [Pseudonocardiaceae bacterium]